MLFLFFLHQQINGKLATEWRYYCTRLLLLSRELKSLLREQAQDRKMRWSQIRVGMDMPYPLDSETAAAIEAAKSHHVLTWEILEEGDEISQWLRESFLAKGRTALPDGAYGLISEIKFLYLKVPTDTEV